MNQRRVLVAGGTGLLGHALLDAAPDGWEVEATWHLRRPPDAEQTKFHPLDVLDEDAVFRLIDAWRPDVVVHAASVGSVDLAERDPETVRRVNVGGLQNVARACARVGATLVFISSNAVFDGAAPPYAEDAAVHAVNTYGAIKIEAEQWLQSANVPHVIFRPLLMYGWPLPDGRSNAVTRWLNDLEAGRPVDVADDIHSMPLHAGNCADAIWAAIRLDRRGVYHVAGADRVTLVAFARETARVFDLPMALIRPVPSEHFTAFAPRPTDTSFTTTKMVRELGVRPSGIREGLAAMRRAREQAR
jgi:dTDP-4-dehydrorhamnose reductase